MSENMVTPNEMMLSGIEIMLNGELPITRDDWAALLNFFAFNAKSGLEIEITLVMVALYEIPVTDNEAVAIAQFQQRSKATSLCKCGHPFTSHAIKSESADECQEECDCLLFELEIKVMGQIE